jgi:hypothetical protein
MKTIYLILIQLFLNCALCLNNKAENESSVTTTKYITQTLEYSDDQRTTLAKSSISNAVLSLMQSGTLAENEWGNNFSSTSSLFDTTNFYTSANSTSTNSNLVEELRNVLIEGTTVATPIEPCSAEGNCIFTKSMEHQFCHCDTDCYIYNDCCIAIKKPSTASNFEYSPYYTCQKGHNSDIYEGLFVVDSCPTGYVNDTDTRMCNEHKISENGPSVVDPEGVVFKNRHCALCHGVNDVESFDVKFIVSDRQVDKLLLNLANLSKSQKIEYMMLHFWFKEIPPKDFVPRPCILHTIEQNNSLCQSYINPVYRFKRGKAFIYRNYFCTPETIRDLTKCLGKSYDKIAKERFKIHPISVMFSFNRATQNDRKNTCDYWSKEVSRHFYDYLFKEVIRHFYDY